MAGPHFPWLELVIRLGSALVLGSLIGAERQWRHEQLACGPIPWFDRGGTFCPAGSTHRCARGVDAGRRADPGVGFLGAGVLMRTGLTVHGSGTKRCSSRTGNKPPES